MDSNALNGLWGSSYCDARGDDMEDFVRARNLNILNVKPRSASAPSGTSFVDITLAGDKTQVSNWRYLDFDSLSDHPLIYFEITTRLAENKGAQLIAS